MKSDGLITFRVRMIDSIAIAQLLIGTSLLATTAFFDRLDFLDTLYFANIYKLELYNHLDYNSLGTYLLALIPLVLSYLTLKSKLLIFRKKQVQEAKMRLTPAYKKTTYSYGNLLNNNEVDEVLTELLVQKNNNSEHQHHI